MTRKTLPVIRLCKAYATADSAITVTAGHSSITDYGLVTHTLEDPTMIDQGWQKYCRDTLTASSNLAERLWQSHRCESTHNHR